MESIAVGIDVSKDALDVYLARERGRKRMRVSNDEAGVLELVREMRGGSYAITLEATGGYEAKARRLLEKAGFEVTVQNPRLARHLAIGLGMEAKTDPIDAENLARTAKVCKRTTPRSEAREARGDVSRAIEALKTDRSDHLRRLHKPGLHPQVAQAYKSVIAALDAQIKGLEKLYKAEVRKSDAFPAYKLALTVKAVGPCLARVLTAELPEDLSDRNVKQICSYAALTPLDNASGKTVRKSKLKTHGNMHIKAALYMPAVSLIKNDPKARELYARFTAMGRTHQQALVPVMHLLLRRTVAVIKRGSAWAADPIPRT